MNSTARFSGESLLASNSDINFDGATVTTNASDELRVISGNNITYNASLNSRGKLLSVGDVTSNGSTTLYGLIGAMDDIRCNNSCSVVGVQPVIINNTFAD
jgi:hypothetical protein